MTCCLLLCARQAYYNPSIIKVVNRLISGVDSIEATELAAEATARVAQQMESNKAPEPDANHSDSDSGDSDTFDTNAPKKPKLSPNKKGGGRGTIIGMTRAKVASTNRIKDIQGSCLYQMSIPDNFNERTYGKLFQRLSNQGIVPLGLLRGTFAGLSVGPRANRTPYVYTNPDKDTEIFKCDKVFVLSTKPLQPDGKLDLKVGCISLGSRWSLLLYECYEVRSTFFDLAMTTCSRLSSFHFVLAAPFRTGC